jgi:N-acetylmuramic acid 6-phosphate etherase
MPSPESSPAGGYALPPTEASNPASRGIDRKSSLEILRLIHEEDGKAWRAVEGALEPLAVVVDAVVEALRAGGRLIYAGAGTSGRLGVLDAAECLPTFGAGPDRVGALIAGGETALRWPVEGAEDDAAAGAAAVAATGAGPRDVVCGIAASGTTPYVWGALEEAAARRAVTALVTCNPGWGTHPRAAVVRHAIVLPVGPEIVAGSTRMKAGTATKLVLNSLSTAAMIRWGKVYDNLMVDVAPLNRKLERRAEGLVRDLAGVDAGRAAELLRLAGGGVKTAIVMGRLGLDREAAEQRLAAEDGILRRALEGGAGAPGQR